jgi:hypothetical protein
MTRIEDNSSSPTTRFWGWLLVVAGGMMALLCGGCTLMLWGASIVAALSQRGASSVAILPLILLVPAIVGGLPAAAGGALAWAGWRIVHPQRPPRAPIDETFS